MSHWYIDPSFDPLQELHDLKQQHEHLAQCHNQLAQTVRELMEQNRQLLAHVRAQDKLTKSLSLVLNAPV
jgi:hypothetical protein